MDKLQDKLNAVIATYPKKDQDRARTLLESAVSSLGDLMATHWRDIDTMILENEKLKGSVSLGVKFDVSEKQPKVNTKISFARKYSDSIDQVLGQATEDKAATGDA